MALRTDQPNDDDVSFPVDPDPVPLTLPGRDQAADGTDAWWRSCAEQALRALARTGNEFQAYDLVSEPYCVPEPDHPNRWGPVFSRACRAGWIERVGAARSKRPRTAGSLTSTWRGTR